jgi:hypothetical protein
VRHKPFLLKFNTLLLPVAAGVVRGLPEVVEVVVIARR